MQSEQHNSIHQETTYDQDFNNSQKSKDTNVTQHLVHQHSESKDKDLIVLTNQDFKEWADNSPLEIPSEQSAYGIRIGIKDAVVRGGGLTEYTTYNIIGQDQKGSIDVQRRYSEFNFLRKKLKERWPGVFIPAIPTKQILGKNDIQVTKNRQRFLNEFLHKLANLPYLYHSDEVQMFLRGQVSDIVKALDKYRKPPVSQLLRKYQQAFPEHMNREDILKQKQKIDQFKEFIKKNQQLLDDLKKHSRNLAQSRDKYNKISTKVFTDILPRYQGNETASIFKSAQFPELDSQCMQSMTNNNPYWLLYDLLKFQQRQAKGMKETITELDHLVQKREQVVRKIDINKEEISELSQGKLTIRSLVKIGTKQQIKGKLVVENQDLQIQKQQYLKVINLATLKLDQQITIFKQSKVRFYNKVIKKVFSVQMHNLEGVLEYNSKLEKTTQKFIE